MNYGRERRIPDVRRDSVKRYVFAAGMAGFITGILCANLWMKEYVLNIGIFHDFFLEQYQQKDIRTEAYLWYLIRIRSIPVLVFAALSKTRYRKMVVVLTILWTGFCMGLVLCTAIIKLKLKGIVLCMFALVPHGLFYAVGYITLFRYMLEYPVASWNKAKTWKWLLIMTAGVLSECYINPVIVHIFLKTL